MPYNEYCDLLSVGKLRFIKMNYDEKYVIVRDENFDEWKVMYEPNGGLAVLEKII